MAQLDTQPISSAGIEPSYEAATSGGDSCAPGTFLHYKNGHSEAQTVTLVTPGSFAGLAIADRAIQIAAGDECMVRVGDEYRDPSTGLCSITYSGVTALTVGCFR